MTKKFLFVGIVAVMMCLFTIVFAISGENERILVKYIKTSDGDTARFEVDGENVRVRFLGINTPEVAGEDKVEEPYGNEAMEYTKNKLDNATKIEIEYDENVDKEDRFGRILAYIWVDDELFQEELVRNGYAKTYMMKANYKYADELKSAERAAKAEKIGVWSDEVTAEIIREEIAASEIEKDVSNDVEYEKNDGITSAVTYIVIILALVVLAVFMSKNKEK